MPVVRNVSPIGDLDVPALRRAVKAGEVVDVTAELAASLLDQPANWAPVDEPVADDTETQTRKAAR